MDYTLVPILTRRIYRLMIVAIFFALVIVSGFSIQWLDATSDTARLVPDDSFVIDYLNAYDDGFGEISFGTLNVIFENQDFSDYNIRVTIHSYLDELESYDNEHGSIIGTVTHWLDSFEIWVNETYNIDITNNNEANTIITSEFYHYLQVFANDTDYAEWDSVIVYDDYDNPTFIDATKFEMFFVKADSLKDQWPLRVDLCDMVEEYLGPDSGYVFDDVFPFAYFEWTVVTNTITNLGYATLGVFIVLLLLMDMRMAVFIILVVVMIDVDLFGWMVLLGISLDSVSFTQLVMAVGLTVDYVIHITHAIADARPSNEDDYETRIQIALKDMGIGVAKGAWTTFIGAIALAFSQSEAFRTFFYMFCGIILIAVTHGLLFVPSILGELSFFYKGVADLTHDGDDFIRRQLSTNIEMGKETATTDQTAITVVKSKSNQPANLDTNIQDTQTAP